MSITFTGHATRMDGTSVGGTFSAISIPPGKNGIATFSYIPAVSEPAINLSFTNDRGLVNPVHAIGISSVQDLFVANNFSSDNIYWLRRLNASYIGPAIRLQRSLDQAQMDFYFNNNGDLPRQAIQDWSSSRNIPIVTIYNQNGLSNVVFPGTPPTLNLVDSTGYPSITWPSGNYFIAFDSASLGQGQLTILAGINSTNTGIFISQDDFVETFRMSTSVFSVAPNGSGCSFVGTQTGTTLVASSVTGLIIIGANVTVGGVSSGTIVSQNTPGAGEVLGGAGTYVVSISRNVSNASCSSDGQPTYFSATGASTGAWHYIANTWSNAYTTNNLKGYVDGTLVDQDSTPYFTFNLLGTNTTLGSFKFGGPNWNGSFRGFLIAYQEASVTLAGIFQSDNATYYSTPLPDSLTALPPTISNVANSKIFQGTSTPLFQTIITDGNITPTETVVITLTGATATLSGTGLTGSNPYTLSSDTPANITTKLQALVLTSAASLSSVVHVSFAVTNNLGSTSSASFDVTVANYGIETAYTAPAGTFTPINMKGCVMDGGENTPPHYPLPFLINYYATKNFGLMRMPVLDAFLTTSATGQQPLDLTSMATIKLEVDRFRAKNMYVIIDQHRFGSVNGIVPGSSVVATLTTTGSDCLIDFWSRIASLFKNYDNVMLELMNEPVNGTTPTAWAGLVPKICTAIRNAGFTGKILIDGAGNFSGAHDWTSSGNAAAFAGFTGDPGNNFAFAPHQYLDSDNSGQHPVAVSGYGSVALDFPTSGLFTTWARANGFKAMVTEGGFAPASWNPQVGHPMTFDSSQASEVTNGIVEGSAMWSFMSSNSDVFIGWTFFASNNFPAGTPSNPDGTYAYILDPPYDFNNGSGELTPPVVDRPQMAVLVANL